MDSIIIIIIIITKHSIMKYTALRREKNGDCAACIKKSTKYIG
jgi:hypothetical protein